LGTTTYEFTVDETNKEARALIIKDIMGDIEIVGKETYKVNIIEEIKIKSNSERKAKKYYESAHTKVVKSNNGNMIEIIGRSFHYSKMNYKYIIVLPSAFNVKIMITGGDIVISNLIGEVDNVTSGGDINLNGITGKVIAKSSGGDIEINDSEGNVNLYTSGGDIEIRNTQGRILGQTSGGDIGVYYVNGNVKTTTSGGSIDFANITGKEIIGFTSGGNIGVEDINGDLELVTSGGDIALEDIEGNIKGKTSGGDITLESVNGNVDIYTSAGSIYGKDISGKIDAETSSGEIEISKTWNSKLSQHDINLKTSSGDIILAIPKNFPFTINARVYGYDSGYEIDSDFPMTITSEFDDKQGSFINGDGTYTIKLKTTRGNIKIEKD